MCWPGQCIVVGYGACVCDTRGSNNCLFTYKQNEKVWWFPSLSELMRINKYSCCCYENHVPQIHCTKIKVLTLLKGVSGQLVHLKIKMFLEVAFFCPAMTKTVVKRKKNQSLWSFTYVLSMQITHTTTKQFLFNTKNYAGTCMNLNWRFKILNKYKRR